MSDNIAGIAAGDQPQGIHAVFLSLSMLAGDGTLQPDPGSATWQQRDGARLA